MAAPQIQLNFLEKYSNKTRLHRKPGQGARSAFKAGACSISDFCSFLRHVLEALAPDEKPRRTCSWCQIGARAGYGVEMVD